MPVLRWLLPAALLLHVLQLAPPSAARPLGGPAAQDQQATEATKAKVFYIFGYGSLLSRASTQKTNCGLSGFAEGSLAGLEKLLDLAAGSAGRHGDPLAHLRGVLEGCAPKNTRAVRVTGLRRGFYASAESFGPIPVHPWPKSAFLTGFSALGVYSHEGSTTTGLVYEADEQEYNRTLRREGGYALQQLTAAEVTVLGGPELPTDARITVFGLRQESLREPSPRAPLSSTYIDVFLSGALELQQEFGLEGEDYRTASPGGAYSSFLEETIRTTHAWSRYWINDRSTPLRPFVQSPTSFAIDAALWKWAPHDALRGMRWPGQPWGEEGRWVLEAAQPWEEEGRWVLEAGRPGVRGGVS